MSTRTCAIFGVRRPVGALVGCDLSQSAYVEFTLAGTRRQVAADQSGDRSPHSKSLAYYGAHELMQTTAGRAGEEGDGVFENGCDDGEAFADGFG